MNIALVTGAGKGLGKGFVEYLLNKGYFVYAGVRDVKSTEIEQQSSNLQIIQLNVEDDESIHSAITEIQQQHGKLHLLVNNAGLNKDTATGNHKEQVCKLEYLDRGALNKMFSVNSVSPLMVAKYAAPLMTDAGSFIVNISSNRASYQDVTNKNANYGYRSSKIALNMITQCMVMDMSANISVFAVHPGSVLSGMNPDGLMQPIKAAKNIYDIIENWNPENNGKYLNNNGAVFPS